MSENEAPNVEAAEVSEAPVENVEAPAAAEEESISDIVSRHATAATEAVAEDSEPADEPEAAAEPAGELSADDVAAAVSVFNDGPDNEDYERAVELLDSLGMLEYEEEGEEGDDDYEPAYAEGDEYDEDDPYAELDYDDLSPEEIKLLELEQQVQELLTERDARAMEQEQALEEQVMAEAQKAFELELDKHFAADGEMFPRDPNEWTSTQRLQAQLTAAMESGAEAQRVLKAYEDERIADYVAGKPESTPAPEVGGASSASSNSNGSPRDDIAKIVSEHLAGGNISQG